MPSRSPLLFAYVLLGVTALSWAGNSIAGRMAAGDVSPMALTTLRWTTALLVMLPLAYGHLRRDAAALRAEWWKVALLGAGGFALFNVLLYSSLERATAINVVLIQAALPALIFLFNFIVFRRRTVALQIVGFLLSLAGVAFVVLGGGKGLGAVGSGEVIAVVAVIVYAGYTVGLGAKPPVHWLSLLTAMGAAAWLVSLPFLAWEASSGQLNWPDSPSAWGVVVYAGLFPALIAQGCFIRAIDIVGANRAGMVVNIVPVLGTLMAVVILGEAFRWYHAVALALALGGIAIAEWAVTRARIERPSEPASVPAE